MKTNNNFFVNMIVIVVAFFCVATSANAQTKAMNSNDAAIVASLGNIHAGCYEVTLVADEKGYLAEKIAEIHTGLAFEVYGGAAWLKGHSDNWGDQNGQTLSFGGALMYNHHKRQWPVDIKIRAFAGINTNVEMETLSTKAFEMGLQPMIGFNPCGSVRPYVFASLDYLNSTSRTLIDNEQFTADIPFQSNAFFIGGGARLELDLFSIKTSKMDRGVKVTKKRPVSLILQGKYTVGKIGEPLGSDLKEDRIQVTAGIAIPLFF